MKRYLTLLLLLAVGQSSAQNTIDLSNGEWPPFMGKDLPFSGVASQIVSEAFEHVDYKVKYYFYPWARAYHTVLSGESQGSVVWSKNPEREQEVLFSEPVIRSSEHFFYLKQRPFDWHSMTDLYGKNIGIARGYYYGEAFQPLIESGKANIEDVTYDIQNFKRLLRSRIDVLIVNLHVGQYILYSNFPGMEVQRVTYHPKKIREVTWHLILSKKRKNSPMLLKKFNHGLQLLHEKGRVDSLLQNILDGQYMKSSVLE